MLQVIHKHRTCLELVLSRMKCAVLFIKRLILDFMSEINPCAQCRLTPPAQAFLHVFSISVFPVVSRLVQSWPGIVQAGINTPFLFVYFFYQRCNKMWRKLSQQAWYVTISAINECN